jgi:Ca2+/Na+ antiporter
MSEFWLKNPLILLDKDQLTEIWPTEKMGLSRKLNSISRLVIILTVIGVILTGSVKILVTSIITMIVLVMLYKTQYEKEEKEDIKKEVYKEGFTSRKADKFLKVFDKQFTKPTKTNPLMNVLLTDIKDQPNRPPAAPAYNERISEEINKNAQNDPRLYQDLGDNLQFEHSMRNFHSMPNTQIPNNQKNFADFCYGNMASCKDGDVEQCSKNMRKLGNVFY